MKKQKQTHTKATLTSMAKQTANIKRLTAEVIKQTSSLTRRDIAAWRQAWQMAITQNTWNRSTLYDIYTDADIDEHLTGAIQQRTQIALAKPFKLITTNGEINQKAQQLFQTKWFSDFMEQTLSSIYWGYTLIELGEVQTTINGKKQYTYAKIVPRKHVVPQTKTLIKQLGDDPQKGIDYTQPIYKDHLVEVGNEENLGLLLKAAPITIAKKNALAYWDTFAELFGMPIRIAKTTARDPKEKQEIENMMQNMGAFSWAVLQEGTDIEIRENTKADAFNVFDKRAQRADKGLSKLILLQTMTIDDGSSLSQSQTHLEIFLTLINKDQQLIADIVNTQLLPIMIKDGFEVKNTTFEWDNQKEYTPQEQLQIEQMLLQHFNVDKTYFENKYLIPIQTQNNSQTKQLAKNTSLPGKMHHIATQNAPYCPAKSTILPCEMHHIATQNAPNNFFD